MENGHAFKFNSNNGETEPAVEEQPNVVYTKSSRPFPGISIIGNSNEHYRGKLLLYLSMHVGQKIKAC